MLTVNPWIVVSCTLATGTPITDLLDDSICMPWLEQHLHPDGLKCPRCASTARRLFRDQGHFPAYRCRSCDGYYTLLTGTVFEKTRQRPATLVLLLRGIAKGEPTARLARELSIGRARIHEIRKLVQSNLHQRLPSDLLKEKVFEADELYQNAGEKRRPAQRSARSAQKTSQQAQRARHV
jgi:transposase-like protein